MGKNAIGDDEIIIVDMGYWAVITRHHQITPDITWLDK